MMGKAENFFGFFLSRKFARECAQPKTLRKKSFVRMRQNSGKSIDKHEKML
jgi:hypothetical protein